MYNIFIPKFQNVFTAHYQLFYKTENIFYNSFNFLSPNIWQYFIVNTKYFKEYSDGFYAIKNFVFYFSFYTRFSSDTSSGNFLVGKYFINTDKFYLFPGFPILNLATYNNYSFIQTEKYILYNLLPNQTIGIRSNAPTGIWSVSGENSSLEIIAYNS